MHACKHAFRFISLTKNISSMSRRSKWRYDAYLQQLASLCYVLDHFSVKPFDFILLF